MRSLLNVSRRDAAALGDIHVLDLLQLGLDAVHLPGEGMKVIRDRNVLPGNGGCVDDTGNGLLDVFNIIELKANLDAGLRSAGLFTGPARKDADHVCTELREDRLEGTAKAGAIGK